MRTDRRGKYEEDDGRVVAKMNVPGMPWYMEGDPSSEEGSSQPLSRADERKLRAAALKYALLLAGIMSLVLVAVVLFCLFIWLR